MTHPMMLVGCFVLFLFLAGYYRPAKERKVLAANSDSRWFTGEPVNMDHRNTSMFYAPRTSIGSSDLSEETDDPYEDRVAVWILPVQVRAGAFIHLRGYRNRVERKLIINGDFAKTLNLKVHQKPHSKLKGAKDISKAKAKTFVGPLQPVSQVEIVEEVPAKSTRKGGYIEPKYGLRMDMAPIEGSYRYANSASVVELSLREANVIIDSMMQIAKTASPATPKTLKVAVAPAKSVEPDETFVKETEQLAKPDAAPPAQGKERVQSWTGIMLHHGFAERALSVQAEPGEVKDPNQSQTKGKSATQYRITIKLDDGMEDNVWGADLLRAIKDGHVENGDRIEIIRHGKRPLPDSKKWKTIYSVTKLA